MALMVGMRRNHDHVFREHPRPFVSTGLRNLQDASSWAGLPAINEESGGSRSPPPHVRPVFASATPGGLRALGTRHAPGPLQRARRNGGHRIAAPGRWQDRLRRSRARNPRQRHAACRRFPCALPTDRFRACEMPAEHRVPSLAFRHWRCERGAAAPVLGWCRELWFGERLGLEGLARPPRHRDRRLAANHLGSHPRTVSDPTMIQRTARGSVVFW